MPVRAQCMIRMLVPVLVGVQSASAAAQAVDWRTIRFETTEATAPDVAVSPDGEWLVFTIVGKLFRLPVKGGEAANTKKRA